MFNPGLYIEKQARGWRRVTDAVLAEEGGHIFAQLWHVGRMSHTTLQPDGRPPVSSVAVQAQNPAAFAYDDQGSPALVPATTPRALESFEVARITDEFLKAAKMAVASGFDGVEIHGANGYLSAVHQRSSQYPNRPLRRLHRKSPPVPSRNNGCRRSGSGSGPRRRSYLALRQLFDMTPYPDEDATWIVLAAELHKRGLAYVHLSDEFTIGAEKMPVNFARDFRQSFQGTLIAAGGFTRESGEAALRSGELDLIAFGRPFIANPDLVERMKNGWPLAVADRSTWYGSNGERSYADFPRYRSLEETA